jgi:AraC-like DNA-binding protein
LDYNPYNLREQEKAEVAMRTEEEIRYILCEQILELYDRGLSLKNISRRLDTSIQQVEGILKNIPIEQELD